MTAPTDFFEVPTGALCSETMSLTCKGPDEERSYVIDFSNQLDPDDYIAPTGITWLAGDTAVSLTNITSHGRKFRFTINGGTLNQQSGLTLFIPLVSGDLREVTFVITIESQGVLSSGSTPTIMGSQGPRGTIIWPYAGSSVPPATWKPIGSMVVRTGDFVIVNGTNNMYTITVNDDSTNTYTFFTQISGGDGTGTNPLANFFYVNTSGQLSLVAGSLPIADPKVADALWLNGDFLTRSAG